MIFQGVFFYYISQYTPVKFGKDYKYPIEWEALGLVISLSSMVCVPIYAVYYVVSGPGTIMEVRQY